ncbi:MAG: glycine cleavage system protein GcvH [Candidatus Cryosericum sp.]|jgi:glycine cleavage system H protein|nr:glycine cleavage system protein GcvH [Caldisericota bacterium]
MKIQNDARYAKSDEWVRVEGGVAVVGVSDYAQGKLGDIVFVGDVAPGLILKAGDILTSVESVKAASDIYSPVSGKVLEVNHEVVAKPELINSDAFGAGWLAKIELSNPDELNGLMSATDYAEYRKE